MRSLELYNGSFLIRGILGFILSVVTESNDYNGETGEYDHKFITTECYEFGTIGGKAKGESFTGFEYFLMFFGENGVTEHWGGIPKILNEWVKHLEKFISVRGKWNLLALLVTEDRYQLWETIIEYLLPILENVIWAWNIIKKEKKKAIKFRYFEKGVLKEFDYHTPSEGFAPELYEKIRGIVFFLKSLNHFFITEEPLEALENPDKFVMDVESPKDIANVPQGDFIVRGRTVDIEKECLTTLGDVLGGGFNHPLLKCKVKLSYALLFDEVFQNPGPRDKFPQIIDTTSIQESSGDEKPPVAALVVEDLEVEDLVVEDLEIVKDLVVEDL